MLLTCASEYLMPPDLKKKNCMHQKFISEKITVMKSLMAFTNVLLMKKGKSQIVVCDMIFLLFYNEL